MKIFSTIIHPPHNKESNIIISKAMEEKMKQQNMLNLRTSRKRQMSLINYLN